MRYYLLSPGNIFFRTPFVFRSPLQCTYLSQRNYLHLDSGYLFMRGIGDLGGLRHFFPRCRHCRVRRGWRRNRRRVDGRRTTWRIHRFERHFWDRQYVGQKFGLNRPLIKVLSMIFSIRENWNKLIIKVLSHKRKSSPEKTNSCTILS